MTEIEFLEKHKDANVIVVEADSHQVVAAEYTTCDGRPRMFPVRYWIDGSAENMKTAARDLLAAVRADVMSKWLRQHHEMELSDGEKTYGFVGVPEW